jgi:hypothetical protein
VTTIIAMMAKRRIQKVRQTQRWECRFFRTVEWCHDSGRLWRGEVNGDLEGEARGDEERREGREGGGWMKEEEWWKAYFFVTCASSSRCTA